MRTIEQIEAALARHELRLLIARCAIAEYRFKVKTKTELMDRVNAELRSNDMEPVSWGFIHKYSSSTVQQ